MVDYVAKAQERIQRANEEMNAGNFEGAANYLNAGSPYAGRAGNAAVNDAFGSAQQRLLDLQTGGGNPGGGGPAGPSQAELDAANNAAAMERQRQQQEYEARVRQRAAIDAVQSAFAQYGLQSLFGKVEEYAVAGYNADAIVMMLRQTPEYKQRFPAMQSLMDKGRAISESQYIDYERNTAAIEQRFGLPDGMLMGHVTDLLTNEVSLAELNDRVTLASADSLNAPQDLRDTLQNYYGLDPDTALAAYYLDPDIALPLLEKQSAAARIGVWGQRQGVQGVNVGMAEYLQELGVNEQQASQGFGQVKQQEGLQYGKGDTAGLGALVEQNVAGVANTDVERAARARTGRFSGGGRFAEDKAGVSGLGSAAG
jgi:hypothetical protein